jgi:hypothetical protein
MYRRSLVAISCELASRTWRSCEKLLNGLSKSPQAVGSDVSGLEKKVSMEGDFVTN